MSSFLIPSPTEASRCLAARSPLLLPAADPDPVAPISAPPPKKPRRASAGGRGATAVSAEDATPSELVVVVAKAQKKSKVDGPGGDEAAAAKETPLVHKKGVRDFLKAHFPEIKISPEFLDALDATYKSSLELSVAKAEKAARKTLKAADAW